MKKQLSILALLTMVIGLNAQTPRLSLYEEFTGETCPPCASTNPGLNQLLALPTNTPKIVAIKWQVPIPSAPSKPWSLYQTNKTEIDWRWKSTGYGYNPGITSAPSSKIDGQEATVFGASSSHPVNLTSGVIATAQSYTSAFSIAMLRAWDKTCSSVNLTITIQATAPFTAVGPLVFRTVMVERLIQFSVQPGTNGETTFEDAAIKSFPTLQGGVSMASSWTVGQTQTFTLNCKLPSYTRKKEEVAFVGFIQDDGNRTVAQAARVDKEAVPQDALSGISAQVDLTCTGLITPTVVVKNESVAGAITSLTLTPIVDAVAGTPMPWTGNIAHGASEVITLTGINGPSTSGSHSFYCDISMSAPVYNLIKNETSLNYMVSTTYQGAAVSEGFVNTAFPPVGFGIINNNGGPSWTRNTLTGGYNLSTDCSKYDFYNNTLIGDKDEFYLPPMNLSSATTPELTFDLAYAQRTSSSDDALEVFVSDDCGLTWTKLYYEHGITLSTTPPTGSPYFPDPSDPSHWRTDFIDLGAYTKPNLLVKFVTTSDNGNNLYLDNINLTFATGINKRSTSLLNASLYPNPTNGTTQLKLDGMKAGSALVSVINTLGQVVYSKQSLLNEGTNAIQIDSQEFASGIYTVRIDANNSSTVKKLSVTK